MVAKRRSSGNAVLLWLLSALFFLRVAGQAVQRWAPQPYLPRFDDFQGSSLPYWVLLSTQLAILATMVALAWRVQRGLFRPTPRAATLLAWAGGIYMAVSASRIVIGLAIPSAPAWFSTWIPAVFHLVLAGYALTLAKSHALAFAAAEEGRS